MSKKFPLMLPFYCSSPYEMSPVCSVSSSSAEPESSENSFESNEGSQCNDFEYPEVVDMFEKENMDVECSTQISERSSAHIKAVATESTNILVINASRSSTFINTTVTENLPSSLTTKDTCLKDKEMQSSDTDFSITESSSKVKSSGLSNSRIPEIDCEKRTDLDGSQSIEERMYVVKTCEKMSAELKYDENESKSNLVVTVSKSFEFTEFVNEKPAECFESPTTHDKGNYPVQKRKRKKQSCNDTSFQLADYDEILKLWGCHTEKSGTAETSDKKIIQECDHEEQDDEDYEKSRFQKRNEEKYDIIELNGISSECQASKSDLLEFNEIVYEKDISGIDEKKTKLFKYQPLMESIKNKNKNALFQSTKHPDVKELRNRGIDKTNMNISDKTVLRADDEDDGEFHEISLEVRS